MGLVVLHSKLTIVIITLKKKRNPFRPQFGPTSRKQHEILGADGKVPNDDGSVFFFNQDPT